MNPYFVVGATTLFSLLALPGDLRKAEKEHKSKLWEGTKSVARNVIPGLMVIGYGFTAATVGFMVPSLLMGAGPMVTGAFSMAQVRNQYIRSITTPFSQRFEMTDWVADAMQRGVQRISGARNLIGSEATTLAARYGRR